MRGYGHHLTLTKAISEATLFSCALVCDTVAAPPPPPSSTLLDSLDGSPYKTLVVLAYERGLVPLVDCRVERRGDSCQQLARSDLK